MLKYLTKKWMREKDAKSSKSWIEAIGVWGGLLIASFEFPRSDLNSLGMGLGLILMLILMRLASIDSTLTERYLEDLSEANTAQGDELG